MQVSLSYIDSKVACSKPANPEQRVKTFLVMVHVHCAPSRTFYLSLNFSFSNSTTNTISLCILLSITMIPSMFCRSLHDVSPIKSRSVPTKYVRSHDVFRTTYEMSDLIRIRIGSEGATDSSYAFVSHPKANSLNQFKN